MLDGSVQLWSTRRGVLSPGRGARNPASRAHQRHSRPSSDRNAFPTMTTSYQQRVLRCDSKRARAVSLRDKIVRWLMMGVATVAVFVGQVSRASAQNGGVGAPAPEVVEQAPEEAELNVRNAEIGALVRIFSKRTKRNYLLDDRVKGKVTMYIPGRLSPDESIKILDSILALKGFTTVPVGENLWKIIPSKEAKQATVPLMGGESSEGKSAAVISRVFPLRYLAADEVQPLVAQLISPDGFVSAFGGSNSLFVVDYEDNSERLRQLVETLDVPSVNRDMTIIPIKHAEAGDIAAKLSELLGISQGQGGGTGVPGARNVAGQTSRQPLGIAGGVPGGAQAGGADGQGGGGSLATGPRATAPQLIADERTNSIIVVADDDTTARIKALISELDTKIDLSGNRFYIYRCQHAKAEDLANVLAGLAGSGGGGSGGAGGPNRSGGSTFGAGAGTLSGQGSGGFGGSSSLTQRGRTGIGGSLGFGQSGMGQGGLGQGGGGFSGQQGLAGTSQRQAASVQLNDSTSVTADPATNTLIIQSNRTDYEKIRSLIDSLDIKRRQVLVEAMLLEVSVDNTQTGGFDFLTSTGGKDGGILAQNQLGGAEGLKGLLSDPTKLSGFSVAAASAGSLKLPGGIQIPTQAVMLTAARSNQNVNVLSAPTLLATDNEPAEIVVGQNIPFLASTSTNATNLNNTFNQIDRQDVGITLRLTPQISSEDFVTLNIFTNVSDIVPTATTDLGPTTTVRSSQTTVITKDGQMIVIGGLMADQNNDSDAGVPFLKDIPILGTAFRRSTERRVRTNLLTFITPHVVKDQFDAREQTIDQRDKVEGVIEEVGSAPDRNEILHSPDLDNVSEVERGEVVPPGTIRGPASINELDENKNVQHSERKAGPHETNPSIPEHEPREVKVSPRIPMNSGVVNRKASSSSGRFPGQETEVERHEGASYVLMKLISGSPSAESPIRVRDGFVAVELPAGASEASRAFFSPGKRVVFDDPAGPITLEVRERHPTRESAALGRNLRSNDWRVLSPLEILRLGQGPWR